MQTKIDSPLPSPNRDFSSGSCAEAVATEALGFPAIDSNGKPYPARLFA